VREEQDRGVSAAQSASFKGCKLIVFAGAGFGGTHLHDVRSNLLRESMPVLPAYLVLNVREIRGKRYGIFSCCLRRPIERHVVRMARQGGPCRHVANPVKLAPSRSLGAFHATPGRALSPVAMYKGGLKRTSSRRRSTGGSWPLAELPFGRGTQNGRCVTPVWLWLEWVRIESRGMYMHIEIMQPIKIA